MNSSNWSMGNSSTLYVSFKTPTLTFWSVSCVLLMAAERTSFGRQQESTHKKTSQNIEQETTNLSSSITFEKTKERLSALDHGYSRIHPQRAYKLKNFTIRGSRSMEQVYTEQVWDSLRTSPKNIYYSWSQIVKTGSVTSTSTAETKTQNFKGTWKIKVTWHNQRITISSSN